MSSHREAPAISKDPVADNTDTYAFVSPDDPGTVTIIANYLPLEAPFGGPNFFEFGSDVRYRINVDNNRDGEPDIVYEFAFETQVANPDSFRSGTPIQISSLHQQAIVDTATNTFTAVFVNTITEANKFTLNDEEVKLGRKGQAFRATLTGHLNAVAPPSGFFGGYAVSTSGR